MLVIQASPERAGKTKMNRASTVSVMSGLEAPDWARDFYGAGEHGLADGEGSGGGAGAGGGSAGATSAAEDERAAYRLPPGSVYSPPQRTSSRRDATRSRATAGGAHEGESASKPQRPRTEAASAPPPPPDSPPTTWRERHGSLLPDSTRKLRNFFGQRPPSELITNHLTEFFPLGGGGAGAGGGGAGGAAGRERYRLSKQVRASIRKSMGAAAGGTLLPSERVNRRHSGASVASRASRASSLRTNGGTGEPVPALPKGGTSWEKEPSASRPSLEGVVESSEMSRFSGSSNGSTAELHITQQPAVPFPSSGGRSPSIKGNRSPRSSSGSALDPPDEADEEAAAAEGRSDAPQSSAMALNSSSTSSSTSTTGDHADTRSLASSLAPSHLDARPQRLSRRMSRLSGSSRLSVGAQSLWERRSKDSDAASIITVDEVTAELETRRVSGVSWRASVGAGARGSDDEEDGEGSETAESEFEDDLSDEEDLTEDEDDEDDEVEDEPGTAKPQGASRFSLNMALPESVLT